MQISNLVFFFLFLLRKITMATGSSSTASSSTVGISFDVDPLGKYSFQVSSLTKKTFQERVDSLIDHIEKTITALERYSSRAVEKFTIGKTFAPARAHNTFDPENEDTWRVDGITKRWHGHYKGIGYDGLVVVGAVSRKMLTDTSYRDRKCNTGVWDQQSYALALESALICHYAFKTFDPRLANESFYPGKKKQIEEDKEEDKAAAGGIVYFAFKYEQKGEDDFLCFAHCKLKTFEGANAHQKWIIFTILYLTS